MTSPLAAPDDDTPASSKPWSSAHQPSQTHHRPTAIHIPKNRSASNLLSQRSSSASLSSEVPEPRTRRSIDAGSSSDLYGDFARSPILAPERDTGLRRIRHPPQAPSRQPSSPSLQPLSPSPSAPTSRKSSFNLISAAGPAAVPFSEDLARFPSESLHSFSFAHQSNDAHNRQNVLKRSIDFMRDKLGWASTSPRIANAQARLTGDEEMLHMIEMLQKANIMGPSALQTGLGIDHGPLTGPAHPSNVNMFEKSFFSATQESESPTELQSPLAITGDRELHVGDRTLTPADFGHPLKRQFPVGEVVSNNQQSEAMRSRQRTRERTVTSGLDRTVDNDVLSGLPTPRSHHVPLKRTYTDVAGYSLQQRLAEAMAKPYQAKRSPGSSAMQQPVRAGTVIERAPHGDRNRNAQSQAIFTTNLKAPWIITSANDLACLVFGVTRAEVRKLGIMEVIQESRRQWLEEKLTNPDSGRALKQQKQQPPPPVGKTGSNGGLAFMGNGVTAKLLSKPPARQTYQSRRSRTEDGIRSPLDDLQHADSQSRGVLLCGDVVPIRKMNGSTGSASLWVKEKGSNLIWVLEEIAEDVAMLTVDEIGLVLRGSGDLEAIFGLDRVRNGMDVQKLIPAWPKLAGTNTGAVDYDAISQLRRFTARTSNSINIPVTIDQVPNESEFRVSSLPHIAGIIVVDSETMQISSSNNVFSAALFGYDSPNNLPITQLIPDFDQTLRVMMEEDGIELVDGIVIPEQSFRRARALLALREGSADAAAIFLRPSGLPAKHRDGAEIMIDIQMRVVNPDRDAIFNETVIDENAPFTLPSSGVVYALWITYSRQVHAVNHGIGPVTPLASRPATPPTQPGPTINNNADSGPPSPIEVNEKTASAESEINTNINILTQQLEDGESTQMASTDPTQDEPYEHPSPDLIEAGVTVIPKKKIDAFDILEDMGQGAYGQVKLARYKKPGSKKMCIKYVTKRRILVDTWYRDRRLGTVPLEIHVLDYLRRDGLQHPNIIEMSDFFEDDINYYIEMVPHGLPGVDLFDYIELRVTMEEKECRKIFKQVAEALRHLHITAKVVHRDIKDENVILDGEGRVKLVDFGSAAYLKSAPFTVFVGTIDYAAPEVLRGSPYGGKEQDVWALGILLYTIIYKENPFYSIDEIMDHDLRVPYVTSDECIDLIRKMLDRDVERRIDIEAVLEHPWSTIVDEDEDEFEGKSVLEMRGKREGEA